MTNKYICSGLDVTCTHENVKVNPKVTVSFVKLARCENDAVEMFRCQNWYFTSTQK